MPERQHLIEEPKAHFKPEFARSDSDAFVHGKTFDCDSSDWSQSDKDEIIDFPHEMFIPVLLSRIVKFRLVTRIRIDHKFSIRFRLIAGNAGKRQIRDIIHTSARHWFDMLNMKSIASNDLSDMAIFATITRSI